MTSTSRLKATRSPSRLKLSRNGKRKKATGCCATSGISATSIAVSRYRRSLTSRHPWPHTTAVSSSSSWLRRSRWQGRGWLSGNQQQTEGITFFRQWQIAVQPPERRSQHLLETCGASDYREARVGERNQSGSGVSSGTSQLPCT